jgi:transcriptional activator of cad operon
MQFLLNTILIDTDSNVIGEGSTAIEIESQSMAVLAYLISHAGTLVTRDMLLNEIWQGKVVTDNSLHRVIAILRKTLDDDSTDAQFIKTVHGKGYILIAQVSKPTQKRNKLIAAIFLTLCSGLLIMAMTHWFVKPPAFSFHNLGNETSLLGIEYLPQLAQDGTSLIFVHRPKASKPQSQLILKTLATQKQRVLYNFLGKVNALAWSDDKQQLALAIQYGEQCQVFHFNVNDELMLSKTIKPLFDCISHSPTQLVWSHNANSLYVLKSMSAQVSQSQLHRFDLLTGKLSIITTPELPDIHGFDRSPDSDVLILHRTLAVNQSEIWLLHPLVLEKRIAVLPFNVQQLLWPTPLEHWILQANDRLYSLSQLGAAEEIKGSFKLGMQNISMSEKGKLTYNTGQSRYTLIEQNLRSTEEYSQFQLSSMNQAAASYAPDGKNSAFLSDRRGQGWELWVCENGKNRMIKLDHQLQLATPQWRPDGKGLILLNDDYQLLYVDIQSEQVSMLTAHDDVVLAGSWASNQDIYFSKAVDEQFQLFKLTLVNNQAQQLTAEGGYFAQLSQDKQYLYFNKRNQPGLWRRELSTNLLELVTDQFGADNYSRWQLVGETLYFRHHRQLGFGLFKYNIGGEVKQIFEAQDIWLFNISQDQSKALISKQEMAYGDIKSGYLTPVK